MNPQRFATVATALTVVIGGCAVVWLAGFGSAGIDNTDAAPIVDRRAPPLTADAEPADAPRATAMSNAAVANTVAAAAVAVTTTNTPAAQHEPEPSAEAASTDASHTAPPEAPPAVASSRWIAVRR
jgi:hypothetical protein